METPINFSMTLFTSDKIEDLPYKGSTPKAAVDSSNDDDDSTFEIIRTYKDLDVVACPYNTNTNSAMRKVLAGMPFWFKKAESLVHAWKDVQDILSTICLDESEDESWSSQVIGGGGIFFLLVTGGSLMIAGGFQNT